MQDEFYVGLLVGALGAAGVLTLLFWLNTRAAYRNGLSDGWRARAHPRDPLWDPQRRTLREYGMQVPLAAEISPPDPKDVALNQMMASMGMPQKEE